MDLGQVIFVFFVMVTLLERQSSGARPFRETLLNFVKTPVIVAILTGIVFNQLGLQEAFAAWAPATSVLDALSLLGGMTTPLVIIAIGYELRLQAGGLWPPALTVAVRLALWMPIGLLLIRSLLPWLGLEPGFAAALATLIVLPPPFVIPLFMPAGAEEERDYVLNTLTLATLVTLIAFALVTIIYPPGG